MLNAAVFHSDHLELSEQFGKDSGYEKSVRRPDLELRVVPGGRAGQDRPERAGLGWPPDGSPVAVNASV